MQWPQLKARRAADQRAAQRKRRKRLFVAVNVVVVHESRKQLPALLLPVPHLDPDVAMPTKAVEREGPGTHGHAGGVRNGGEDADEVAAIAVAAFDDGAVRAFQVGLDGAAIQHRRAAQQMAADGHAARPVVGQRR